jgi:UDP-N-acetylmuramoyl-tripeptide--D-alanyl-D-alanine ligase
MGVITCVRPVHVGGFGHVDEIAQAKGEIYQGLAANGIAVLNADEPYFDDWVNLLTAQKVITFGLQSGAVTAKNSKLTTEGKASFLLCINQEEIVVHLPLLGEFNVLNALAAAACAFAMHVPITVIKQGLESMQAVKGRLVPRRGYKGALLLDDHYNSNPAALKEALKLLATYPGKKFFAMGDMLDLGDLEKSEHESAARWAQAAGVERLFAFGKSTEMTVAAFGHGAQHFTSHADLAAALREVLDADAIVLIKGSRGTKMEEVVSRLLE